MKQLPTAEETAKSIFPSDIESGFQFESFDETTQQLIKKAMIEFAKLHVEAQAIEIAEKAELSYADGKYDCPAYCEESFNMTCDDLGNCHYIDRELILRVYPLTNIK